jgi:hypothetical protein
MEKAISVNGLKIKSGTMHERHAFTTQATQEALGHTTLVATQNYRGGFEHSTKGEVANSLMQFDNAKPKSKFVKKTTGVLRRVSRLGPAR